MKFPSLLDELQFKISQRNMRLQKQNPNESISIETNVPKEIEIQNLYSKTISPRIEASKREIEKIFTGTSKITMKTEGRDWHHNANAISDNKGFQNGRKISKTNATTAAWVKSLEIQNRQLSNYPREINVKRNQDKFSNPHLPPIGRNFGNQNPITIRPSASITRQSGFYQAANTNAHRQGKLNHIIPHFGSASGSDGLSDSDISGQRSDVLGLNNWSSTGREFELPEVELKPKLNRIPSGNIRDSGPKPNTPRPRAGFVSQAVQMMEQQSQTSNLSKSSNMVGPRPERYESIIANNSGQIHADDDHHTRIDKIRKTIQKFDLGPPPLPPGERGTVKGKESLESKRSTPSSRQNTTKEVPNENIQVVVPSTYRVTVLNPEKSTKKSPKPKRKTKFHAKAILDNEEASETINLNVKMPNAFTDDDLHESCSHKLPEISKSEWRRKVVRSVSRVQPSVLINWDTVNAQIASKLRSGSQGNSSEDEKDVLYEMKE